MTYIYVYIIYIFIPFIPMRDIFLRYINIYYTNLAQKYAMTTPLLHYSTTLNAYMDRGQNCL